MATRANKPTKSDPAAPAGSSPLSVPSLARGPSGPSLGSAPLLLRPGRGPWTWCISAAKLGCRNGQIVPLPVMAWHAPGISANVRGDGGQGFVNQLSRQGYVPIPHDFLPAVAFGQNRAGSPDSTYLDRHMGISMDGRQVTRWVDAWRRPSRIGHRVEWMHDEEGRDAFLVAALIALANGGEPLREVQIRIATQPLIRRIESEANRATERSRLIIRQLASHLPPEHIPASVHAILRRHDIEIEPVAAK